MVLHLQLQGSIEATGLPWWLSGKESACQCRRPRRFGFDSWVWNIPWSREGQPAPVFLPGKSHGPWSLMGHGPWGHERVWCDLSTKKKTVEATVYLIKEDKNSIFFPKILTVVISLSLCHCISLAPCLFLPCVSFSNSLSLLILRYQ